MVFPGRRRFKNTAAEKKAQLLHQSGAADVKDVLTN